MNTRTRSSNQHRASGIRSDTRSGSALMRSALLKQSSSKVKDLRQHHRFAVAATLLRVTWLDINGDLKIENHARPIDVSEKGIAVQLPEAALLLSRVRLESESGEALGHGKVRYCRPSGAQYVVGIEFSDSLCWRAPEGS